MPTPVRVLIVVLLATGLVACAGARKPEQPAEPVAVSPQVVTVIKRIYVPIPAALTQAEAVAEGPIAQCFEVAAQRRAALERANAKLAKAAAIQGTEATP